MRILFFFSRPSALGRTMPSFPLGVLSIATYLSSKGHAVKIIDRALDRESPKKKIREFNPDLVGVTVISDLVYYDAIRVSQAAKKEGIPVAWGGYLASALAQLALKEPCVDYIVMREGELTYEVLLEAIKDSTSVEAIDGLAYKNENGVHINKPREFADLAEFPTMDWSLIDVPQYFQSFFFCKRMVYIYSSKGCPFDCTFCYNGDFNLARQTRRPIEHIMTEIEQLVSVYNVDGIYFSDEFWYYPKPERERFLDWCIRRKDLAFVWGIQTRLGVYDRQDLQKMYDAGCRWILFGVEGGTPERIKNVRKHISLDNAKETVRDCKEIGIITQTSFIIGYPEEDADEIRATLQVARDIDSPLIPISILYLEPGSEIYNEAIASGRYEAPKSLKAFCKINRGDKSVVNLSAVPERDLRVVHFYCQWKPFSQKDSVPGEKYGILKKYASDTFIRLRRYGVKASVVGAAASVRVFFTVLWYSHAYPGILKKYGLK